MNLNALGGTRLLSDTFLYGIANIFQKLFSFLIVFFLSKNLTVENYGIVDFILTLVALSSIIVIFGQDYAIARYFNQEEDNNKKKIIISQSLIIHLLQIILFLPIIYLLVFYLKKNFFLKEYELNLIILALLSIFSLVIINFCQTVLKFSFQRTKFILISFVQGFLFFLSIIYLIYFSNLNVRNILFFYLIINLLTVFISIYSIKNWLILTNKNFLINKKLIKFGISFGLVALIANSSIIFERLFILEFLNLYYLGIYSLALKIGIIVHIIINSILFGWEPYFLSNLKNKNLSMNLNLMLKITTFFCFILVFFLDLISEYIILFLGNENYIEAKFYILPIVVGIVFQELYRIPSSGILESKKVYWFTITQIICFTFLILAIFLFKELINLKLIVYIICFNYFFKFIFLSIISNSVSKIKLNFLQLISILIIYFNLFLIMYYFNIFDVNDFIKFSIILISSVFMLIFYLSSNELKIIKKIILNFIN